MTIMIMAAWRHGSVEVVEPEASLEASLRDADHHPVLGTLLTSGTAPGASYLVTGAKDLLALAGRYAVLTPAQFWDAHGGL